MSFGKKGVVQGAAAIPATSQRGFGAKPNPSVQARANDPHACARAAFIAAERERAAGLSSDIASLNPDSAPTQPIPASPAASPMAQNAPAQRQQYSGPVPSYTGAGQIRPKSTFFDQFAPDKPSMIIAYILWFVLSNISAHRFYLGAHKSALQQIGLLMVSAALGLLIHPAFFVGALLWMLWLLGDIFLIPGLHRKRMSETRIDTGVFA